MPGIKKILNGVLKFRSTLRTQMVDQFKEVKDNPQPTAVYFTCIDSRLIASHVCQADVGDMFVVRNAGNLVPRCTHANYACAVSTEPGALELGCVINDVRHVVVCGHSDCKAMNLLYSIKDQNIENYSPLQHWLKQNGAATVEKFHHWEKKKGLILFQGEMQQKFQAYIDPENRFSIVDRMSMINCLQQLEHVASYPFLKEKLESNKLRLHAMYFDIYTADMFMFSRKHKQFIEVNEDTYGDLLEEHEC